MDDEAFVPPRIRNRLETQGYVCKNEPEFAEVVPWTRFSPALCSIFCALGTILASPLLLGGLAATAAVGTVSAYHPFDHIYNHGIRHVTGTGRLPKNAAPRRFACAVGTVWLAAIALAFWVGAALTGYVLGALFVAVSGIVATTYFCIPSVVYRILLRRPVASAE